MKYLLIGFLIFTQTVFSQETPATFWNKRCDFKTDGTGKSLGLKIKLSVPCAWKQADGERPHVVKKFSYGFSGGSSVMQTITITKMPQTPSKAEVDEMFTQNGLKELGESLGTYISGRKLKVDGLDCGEITFKMKRENPVGTLYIYSLHYYFVYKDKMIVIGFSAGSTSDETSKSIFENYKTLFRGIAGTTVFLSKWE